MHHEDLALCSRATLMQKLLTECLEKLRAYWHLTIGVQQKYDYLFKQRHNANETRVLSDVQANTVIDEKVLSKQEDMKN
jgi:hypothetical protein